MSDEILSVETPFSDVAALAQGYMNRADGERLLLPLSATTPQGGGVRFVVFLVDGTPAFAGAGLCLQVSDQGGTVPPEERFETLLNTLQFDERSRPVYDYIVAVRNAAYTRQQDAPAEQVTDSEAAPSYEEASAVIATPLPEVGPPGDSGSWSNPPIAETQAAFQSVDSDEAVQARVSLLASAREPSFVPPPIPTGLLTRPARATHWQPAPPRRPTPRPASGMFRYGSAGLPRPARPPRPDLDPEQWVQPAPHP
jgi:hypothetical protein